MTSAPCTRSNTPCATSPTATSHGTHRAPTTAAIAKTANPASSTASTDITPPIAAYST
ncbi:MAG TPA: hypothetical protein VFN90_09100 [Gemmatimonadales bacterium]|nr:hypothetical protein [Gemmatimonadales bacterium]